MLDSAFLLSICEKISNGTFFITDYGHLEDTREVVNGEVRLYESKVPEVKRISELALGEKVSMITFDGLKVGFTVSVLTEMLGSPQIAYNFRDDITTFAFEPLEEHQNFRRIRCEIDGDLANAETVHFDGFIIEL